MLPESRRASKEKETGKEGRVVSELWFLSAPGEPPTLKVFAVLSQTVTYRENKLSIRSWLSERCMPTGRKKQVHPSQLP